MCGLLGRVIVEALAALLAQPLCVNHALQQNARTVLGIACVFEERLLDGEAGVEPDAI